MWNYKTFVIHNLFSILYLLHNDHNKNNNNGMPTLFPSDIAHFFISRYAQIFWVIASFFSFECILALLLKKFKNKILNMRKKEMSTDIMVRIFNNMVSGLARIIQFEIWLLDPKTVNLKLIVLS